AGEHCDSEAGAQQRQLAPVPVRHPSPDRRGESRDEGGGAADDTGPDVDALDRSNAKLRQDQRNDGAEEADRGGHHELDADHCPQGPLPTSGGGRESWLHLRRRRGLVLRQFRHSARIVPERAAMERFAAGFWCPWNPRNVTYAHAGSAWAAAHQLGLARCPASSEPIRRLANVERGKRPPGLWSSDAGRWLVLRPLLHRYARGVPPPGADRLAPG